MGQRHSQSGENLERAAATDDLTVEEAARRLEADAVTDVARAAFDHAGDLATLEYGRTAAVLGAVRLATRRARTRTVDREQLAATFDVDPNDVVAAQAVLARHLTPPAADDEIRSLRRRLIVAHELLAAAEGESVADPELPGSSLVDAAPDLLARASAARDGGGDGGGNFPDLDESALRAHVERLEADLEFARLGTKLAVLVDDNE